jgi:hypothetical protein
MAWLRPCPMTSEGIDVRHAGAQTRSMTTTTQTRTHVSNGCLAEYEAFAELIEGLTDKEWDAAARCSGWQTRDLAGHVVGLAEDTAAGVPGSRNADEEAASVRADCPI